MVTGKRGARDTRQCPGEVQEEKALGMAWTTGDTGGHKYLILILKWFAWGGHCPSPPLSSLQIFSQVDLAHWLSSERP